MRAPHPVTFLLLVGCGGTSDLIIDGAARPIDDATCSFGAESRLADDLTLDVGERFTLRVPFLLDNRSNGGVTPIRFDMQWACDAIGFGADLGPLFVPKYAVQQPFCRDTRAEGRSTFVGFDVLMAEGTRIEAGTRGVFYVDIVPQMLGDGIDELLNASVVADECIASGDAQCNALAEMLPAANVDPQQIRAFSVLDGNYADAAITARGGTPPDFGAQYTMRMTGVVEATTDDGALATSNEVQLSVGFCKNCGRREGDVRMPRDGFDCYADQP